MELTPYGKEIKKRLIDLGRNQAWLIAQVKGATGQYCDSSLIYKLSTGQLNVPKIRTAVNQILGIWEDSGLG